MEPLRQDCDGSHRKVDRLLIRTAADQAGIGNNDGHIARSAPTVTGRTSPIRSHAVVTDTNPRRPRRPAVPYSQSDNAGSRACARRRYSSGRRRIAASPSTDPYTHGMADPVTTMKITTATRDRLRTHASTGESLEEVVVHALDAYESAQFWARAEAWGAAETPTERAERKASEAEWDALMDGLR